MSTYILQLFNGISVASILLLIALGLSITFGLMKIINMAHGELIMFGAYTTYIIQKIFAESFGGKFFDMYFIISIPASFIISALLGIIIEVTIIKFLYGRPLDSLLATWGISLVMQQLARSIFGAPNVDVKSPSFLQGYVSIGDITLPYSRLLIIFIVTLCLIGMYLFLYRSKGGRNIRAVMQNRDMAACLGINVRKVDTYTFALGAGLAGIAGCVLSLIGSIGPSIGTYYIVDAFMVVVLGGVGRLIGAVAGAVTMGMANTWVEYFTNASLSKFIVFALIIVFLQWKSNGMFSIRSRALDE